MSKKRKKTEEPEKKTACSFTGEDFEQSVIEMNAAQGKKPIAEKKKLSLRNNLFSIILIVIFASVFIVCAVMLADNIWNKIKGDSIYDEFSKGFDIIIPGQTTTDNKMYKALGLASSDSSMQTLYDRLNSGKTDASSEGGQYASQLASMRAQLSSYKAVNSDVYGMIYVPDTHISYPVMRGSDNEYYLDHVYTHANVAIGSIFVDFATKDKLEDNRNTIIYGHNVTTGSMFHDVTKFLQQDFFNNTNIYIYTMDGIYIYKPVSIYQTTSDYYYYKTDFANDSSFVAFGNEIIANSKHASGETISAGDTLITLSTCTNGAQNGRYALHAKLIEVIS